MPIPQDLLSFSVFLHDMHFVDWKIIGKLARRGVQKHKNTVRLLGHNNHICYLSEINAVSPYFRCPNFDKLFERTSVLEQHLTSCSNE